MSELRPRSELRSATPGIARHGRLKRSRAWPTVLAIVAASLATVLVSTAAVGAVVLNSLTSEIETVEFGEPDAPPIPAIGAIEGGFNILIVGSDTRLGQNGIGGSYDDESGNLNDVNILMHVSQDQTNAVVISFPRDMVVDIPECPADDGSVKGYTTQPLNEALSAGGLNCVAMTITELTGLPIQFAGTIDFTGVIAMGDAIGGVPVCVDGPIHDDNTGLVIDQAGTYTLLGVDALAFLRTREHVGDGSDLTRISSQQVYLSSLVRTLKSAGTLGDLGKVYNLSKAALQSMQLSPSLASLDTMASIALALKDIPIENVTFVQYPGFTGGDGVYAGKVEPDRALGDELISYVAADQPFKPDPEVAHGTVADPTAPVETPDPTAETPDPTVETTDRPTLTGLSGVTADEYRCSVSNDY
ncbi:LCP family protein required for cell wall assembly [Leifsonia sp. AK011]|uniref:LCP family protein n=1 Tax=Leifsonia sp. AK011 TaxID=2723075 RepID=UPI0015CE8AAD|nr:LCP family protein [Leifsonia sp. AK011]NYF09109.1 LCP family protein required for cell wall assembly [Leifsonia sp. AK011]